MIACNRATMAAHVARRARVSERMRIAHDHDIANREARRDRRSEPRGAASLKHRRDVIAPQRARLELG
jgi:hypothetical protein